MDDYVVKYATSGISLLFTQIKQSSESPIEFIDPICTVIKLSLLHYKDNGTKISIKNNVINIQDASLLQGLERWWSSDDRNQLYQLKLPIFYFRGIVLGFIKFEHFSIDEDILLMINDLAIKGLKKMRITYDNNRQSGSLIKNSIDDYIKILNTNYTLDDYMSDRYKFNKPTLFAIYNEYTKLWDIKDFKIITDLFEIADGKENPVIQNKLADAIDHFIMAKDLTLDTIRPD